MNTAKKIAKLTDLVILTKKLDLEFSVIKGEVSKKRETLLKDMETKKEVLKNKNNVKNYLLQEIESFNALNDGGYLNPELLDFVEKLATSYINVEKDVVSKMWTISSFTEEEILAGIGYKLNTSALYYLSTYLEATRNDYCGKKLVPIYRFIETLDNETIGNVFKLLNRNTAMKMLSLDGNRISLSKISSLERLLDNVYNENLISTINYISQFVVVRDNEMEILLNLSDVERKTLKNTIQKYYFNKCRNWESNDNYMYIPIMLFFSNAGDINMLRNFCKNVEQQYYIDGCFNDLSYLDIAMGGRYSTLIREMPSQFNELVRFSLLNKKKAFLNLLNDNLKKIQAFINKDGLNWKLKDSCLFKETIYKNVLNVNEININDLLKLLKIDLSTQKLNKLFSNITTKLTPKEFIELSSIESEKTQIFYLTLLNGKVDDKLLILRQLKNLEIDYDEYGLEWENSFERIARKLETTHLAKRLDSFHIKTDGETLLKVLSLGEEFEEMIEEARTETELLFIFRNKNNLDLSLSLQENIENYIEVDEDSKNMLQRLNLSEEFLETHKESIREFLLLGNATIVEKYCSGMDITRKNSILKIAKAEMSGQMELLKFHNLEKEIEMMLSVEVIEEWKNNRTNRKGGFVAYETYSFNDTMLIGEKPGHTCMNYKDGQYRSCLLANFDSNKKIIFVKKNGRIVARAIIRLTKSLKSDEKRDTTLSFLDVENKYEENETRERLTIFLERGYFSFVNDKEKETIIKQFIELAKEKAIEMDARLLISNSYNYYSALDDVKNTNMSIFISHTKNEVQYMDSFGGTNNASDEGGYKSCSCKRVL